MSPSKENPALPVVKLGEMTLALSNHKTYILHWIDKYTLDREILLELLDVMLNQFLVWSVIEDVSISI